MASLRRSLAFKYSTRLLATCDSAKSAKICRTFDPFEYPFS